MNQKLSVYVFLLVHKTEIGNIYSYLRKWVAIGKRKRKSRVWKRRESGENGSTVFQDERGCNEGVKECYQGI